MIRIAFATCAQQPQLYEEERELLTRLRAQGIDASAQIWSAPEVDWKAFDLVVIRSTWDYFEHVTEFRKWLTRLEDAEVRLQNPVPVVRWNMDKLYLLDLAEQGVRIVPTQFVRPGESMGLAEILAKYGWTEAVLKPAISGGAFRTERVNATNAASRQGALDALREVGALVQPFIPEITVEGEWSLFFFGGAFSHAVVKTPAPGDYRVQPQFGGQVRRVDPPAELIAEAAKIIRLAPEPLLYARVDGVRRDGRFLLMELEAIEPYLFLSHAPDAMPAYLDAVLGALRPRSM